MKNTGNGIYQTNYPLTGSTWPRAAPAALQPSPVLTGPGRPPALCCASGTTKHRYPLCVQPEQVPVRQDPRSAHTAPQAPALIAGFAPSTMVHL